MASRRMRTGNGPVSVKNSLFPQILSSASEQYMMKTLIKGGCQAEQLCLALL